MIWDTIKFYPHDIPMPPTLAKDKILQAASKLKHAIKIISSAPFHKVEDTQMEALSKLAEKL